MNAMLTSTTSAMKNEFCNEVPNTSGLCQMTGGVRPLQLRRSAACDPVHSQRHRSRVKLTLAYRIGNAGKSIEHMVTIWFLVIAIGLVLVGVLELLDS